MTRVAVLFADPNGVYANLPGVDMWDEARDARLYAGPWPVVAHPPCARWCQLASVNAARWGAMVGDDGGCFESVLESVRAYGGVLEHPAVSLAWPAFDLPKPRRWGWSSRFGDDGWVTEVSQVAYGHKARKATWLYAVGVDPSRAPVPRWWDGRGEMVIGGGVNSGECVGRPKLDGADASATPLEFRDFLLEMAWTAAHQGEVTASARGDR